MDKTAIKNYAVKARKDLIEAVKVKAQQLYIFEDNAKTLPPGKENEQLRANGIFLSPAQLNARARLYSRLQFDGTPYKPAIYNRVIENIAYTWFNRLIALRFMEVNGYLPSNIRILSSKEPGRIEPDAMREADRLDYVDQRKIAELRADTSINASEKLYKYILIQQCNALSAILPGMFQRIDDYTQLLLPDALLAKGGIVYDLVNSIHEDNFSIEKQGQIEIIGWLYQYYISEKKDEVFAALKKNVKITKDTIPAATQLFTPEWIVKYMVENSLGRLWLESNPNAELRNNWKYYVDEAEQEPAVTEQLRVLRSQNPVKRPEDIKLIDPCMGSGHILVYAFDVLYQIYKSVGYSEREIPNLILQHNMYGLDIDDRAEQLAYFALMMKARSYNRRFFRQDIVPQPMVYSTKGDNELEEYGSLLKVENLGEKPELPEELTLFDLEIERKQQAWIVRSLLAQKYDVVVTNPPYMGSSGMSDKLIMYVKSNYPNSKSDLFATFIEQGNYLVKSNGYYSMVTMQSWMFLSSYEALRNILLKNSIISSLLQIGYNSFPELNSKIAQAVVFSIGKYNIKNYMGCYFDLTSKYTQSADKEQAFFAEKSKPFIRNSEDYSQIPGSPISYWISENVINIFFVGMPLKSLGQTTKGLITGDNNRFMRNWWELNNLQINYTAENDEDAYLSNAKWFPCNKGGEFRKWFGNNQFIINWFNRGYEILNNAKNDNRNSQDYYSHLKFRPVISWTSVSSSKPSFRFEMNNLIDHAGMAFYPNNNISISLILGLMNSKVVEYCLALLSPTLNFNAGEIGKIPVINEKNEMIEDIVNHNVDISRSDWNSFETSWDFQRHPLI